MTWQMFPQNSKAAIAWLDFIDDQDSTYFLWHGAVRSTKTYGSILAACDYIENIAPPGQIGFFGKTVTTLKQNVLDPLQNFVGPSNCRVNMGTGMMYLFGRPIYLFGCPNIEAVSKIQGKGLVFAYCDESTTYPDSVWEMIGTRTSANGFRVLSTMNPAGPRHNIKKNYIDRLDEVDGKAVHFRLDDNPFLKEKDKTRLKKQYTGLWKKRFIDGEWVASEGAIYDMFDEDVHVISEMPNRFSSVVAGIDFGTSAASSFILLGKIADGEHRGKWLCFREYFYAGKNDRRKTNSELVSDFGIFLTHPKKYFPSSIEVDPSAASLKTELIRKGYTSTRSADNAVVDGIRIVSSLLAEGKLLIHDSCQNLIEEISGYCWDSKATENGEDKPIKLNDHCCDALRYAVVRANKMI